MKIAVLGGLGSIGHRHAQNAKDLGHEVAIYDPPSGAFTKSDALGWCDAVVIATPSHRHLADLWTCVREAKPCLVEKPIALLADGSQAVEKLLRAAEERQVKIAVGFNLRFHPAVVEAREQLAGAIFSYASFICAQQASTHAIAVGNYDETLCHELDLARFILQREFSMNDRRISGIGSSLTLRTWGDNWNRIHVHSSILSKKRVRRAVIIADHITIDLDLEADPVTNEHYKEELAAFLRWVEMGDKDYRLATGDDGLRELRLREETTSI